jgi:hypothetical protein
MLDSSISIQDKDFTGLIIVTAISSQPMEELYPPIQILDR